MGARAGMDDVEKILDPIGTRNSDPSVLQPVASLYTDHATPAPRQNITSIHRIDATHNLIMLVGDLFKPIRSTNKGKPEHCIGQGFSTAGPRLIEKKKFTGPRSDKG
jgi:hypothetical protein